MLPSIPRTPAQRGWGLAEPKEPGREGPPHVLASPPSHLAELLHVLLAPSQNPTWVSLGAAHPAWGTERVVGAGQQGPLPSLKQLQERPPELPLALLQPAGSQGTPPKYPCGIRGAGAQLGQGRGSRARDQCRGWVTAGEANPGDGVGVPGLEGVADRCCQARGHPRDGERVENPPFSPRPPPELPLPSSGDVRSPDSSACCSLWRESRLNPKETQAAPAASHPPRSPRLPRWGCSRPGSFPSILPRQLRPCPALPAPGEPPPLLLQPQSPTEDPPKPFPASNESPATAALCLSTVFFLFFSVFFFRSGCQADLAASRPLPAPQQTQLPTEPRHHLTTSQHPRGDGRHP